MSQYFSVDREGTPPSNRSNSLSTRSPVRGSPSGLKLAQLSSGVCIGYETSDVKSIAGIPFARKGIWSEPVPPAEEEFTVAACVG